MERGKWQVAFIALLALVAQSWAMGQVADPGGVREVYVPIGGTNATTWQIFGEDGGSVYVSLHFEGDIAKYSKVAVNERQQLVGSGLYAIPLLFNFSDYDGMAGEPIEGWVFAIPEADRVDAGGTVLISAVQKRIRLIPYVSAAPEPPISPIEATNSVALVSLASPPQESSSKSMTSNSLFGIALPEVIANNLPVIGVGGAVLACGVAGLYVMRNRASSGGNQESPTEDSSSSTGEREGIEPGEPTRKSW